MEENHAENEKFKKPSSLFFPNPTLWFTTFISLQADILLSCLLALFSPLLSIISLFSPPKETKENVKFAAHAAAGVPSKVANGILLLIKKVGFGILAAAYVGMILTLLLIASFVIGFGLVHYWVEEPLNLTERLNFDYSLVKPEAILSFSEDLYSFNGGLNEYDNYMKVDGVPIGHTYYVSLVLILPESDYNREVGVFQLNAELIMSNGIPMAKATHPCMLHFSSWPVRLMRTFTMAIPLMLGIKAETQTITIPMIKHKEGFPRTEAIRITLVPRAGTNYVPQVYEAELILRSQPPWRKELVRRWRWTFSVWISFYIYTIVLVVLLFSFRQVILPLMTRDQGSYQKDYSVVVQSEMEEKRPKGAASVPDLLKIWQQSRRKRRALLQDWDIQVTEYVGSSKASSISLTRDDTCTLDEEDTCTLDEEDTGDSESVCDGYRGF